MKTLSALPHHDFAIHAIHSIHHLLDNSKELFAKARAATWEAITSTGPKRSMPLDEMERYVSEAADPEDEARRLRAWDDYVNRMRGFPPRA